MDGRVKLLIGLSIYLVLLWTVGIEIVATLRDAATSTIEESTSNSGLIRAMATAIFNPLSFSVPAIAVAYKTFRS